MLLRFFLLLVLLAPGVARAQADAVEEIQALERQAMEDLMAGDVLSARIGLREAMTIGEGLGPEGNPLLARLYVDLSVVFLDGMKDEEKARRALSTALGYAPELRLHAGADSPAMKKLLAAVRAPAPTPAPSPSPAPGAPPTGGAPTAVGAAPTAPAAAAAPAPATSASGPSDDSAASAPATSPAARPTPARRKRAAGEEPDLPAEIPQPLYCPAPDEAPPGRPIAIHCVLQPDIQATKVVLHYRLPGRQQFRATRARPTPRGWYRSTIPGEAVSGSSFQYYVEALDAQGLVVAEAGRDDSPSVMMIREGARPVTVETFVGERQQDVDSEGAGEEDDPLRALERQRARERQAAGIHRRDRGKFFLGLGAGSGYGWHPRGNLEFYDDAIIEAGALASGLYFIAPELGYQLTDTVALSVQGRIQRIAQSGSGEERLGSPATGAIAALARIQYFVGPRNVQLALSGYVGGGDGFRLTLPPQLPDYRRNDSVRGGGFVAGAGLGIIIHINPRFALVLDGRGLVGQPDLAVVGDLSAGLQVSL